MRVSVIVDMVISLSVWNNMKGRKIRYDDIVISKYGDITIDLEQRKI